LSFGVGLKVASWKTAKIANAKKLNSETLFGIEKRKTAHLSASRSFILVEREGIEPLQLI
jgi:hypothetical protein